MKSIRNKVTTLILNINKSIRNSIDDQVDYSTFFLIREEIKNQLWNLVEEEVNTLIDTTSTIRNIR